MAPRAAGPAQQQATKAQVVTHTLQSVGGFDRQPTRAVLNAPTLVQNIPSVTHPHWWAQTGSDSIPYQQTQLALPTLIFKTSEQTTKDPLRGSNSSLNTGITPVGLCWGHLGHQEARNPTWSYELAEDGPCPVWQILCPWGHLWNLPILCKVNPWPRETN